jgi:hypothetical protein
MSKADNKELEEAIKSMQKLKIEIDNIFYALHTSNPKKGKERTAIGIVLKELKRLQEDCIEKDKIREKIEERKFKLQQEYRNFEDDIELNILKELLEGK